MGAIRRSLIGATVALACLDAFLAIRVFRAHEQTEVQQRVNDLSRLTKSASIPATRNDSANAAGHVAADPAPHQERTRPAGPRLASLESELKMLTDPEARQAKVKEHEANVRGRYRGLIQALRLSPEESTVVFELLAEQAVNHEVQSVRSLIAGRDGWVDEYGLDEETQEHLALVLGPERWTQFEEFRDRTPERHQLAGLQSRLGFSDALNRDEAERLREIMRDERRRFTAIVTGLGKGVAFPTGYPEEARRRDANRAAQLQFDDEQIGRVTEHHARIRERAATFLNAEQLLRLQQLQENTVIPMRRVVMQRRRVDAEVDAMRRASVQP